jgi:small subunit ribosomal protein S5
MANEEVIKEKEEEKLQVPTIEVEAPKKEEEIVEEVKKDGFDKESWKPRTKLGQLVKEGAITEIDQILDKGTKILEAEIVDALMNNLEVELLMIGQSKGKFGGGSRRAFKQTQKKTAEGNKPHFACCAVVGNKDGYLGLGYGKAKETVPAREKAIRNAKMAIFKISRGSGSWEDGSSEPHSIPFAIEGRCGSVRVKLMPAPKGQGLVVASELQKVLKLAGIEDVWSFTRGDTSTRMNLLKACIAAMKKLTKTKLTEDQIRRANIVVGKLQREMNA